MITGTVLSTRHVIAASSLAMAGIACAGADAPSATTPTTPTTTTAPTAATTAATDDVETVVVKSQRLAVENLIDRKVYSVASDVQSTFGSLSDILSVIPSVDVDPDGAVSLRGDPKVLILIDGKPSSQFSGASAGDALQSIPAQDIERIEILTTPPAEFKADGASGAINIIMRKHRLGGTNGTAQASAGSGGRYVASANGSYNSGPWSASLNAGYKQDYKERKVESTAVALGSSGAPTLTSTNGINERVRREVPWVRSSAEYTLNERQSFSGSASWDDRGGLRTYTQLDNSFTPDGVVTGATRRLSSGHDPATDIDERLAFTQKFDIPDEKLTLSLDRSTTHQDEHFHYIDDSFVPAIPRGFSAIEFLENYELTEFDADYVRPVATSGTLKLGYAFELDGYSYNNAGGSVDPVTGFESFDPSVTNDFNFHQRIQSLYASYQIGIGKWTVLGGLRGELTGYEARQISSDVASRKNYFQVYPNLHGSLPLSDQSTLSFGASRRVVRPDPSALNPYVDHEYTPTLSGGNFDLRPQYSESFETGYAYQHATQNYSVTGYYRLNRDSFTDVTEYLADGVTLTTPANLPRDKSAGVEFTAAARVLPQLSLSASGNLFYSQIDTSALGISGLQSTVGLNAKARLEYRPTDANIGQITLTRTDKRLTPQGYVGAVNIVNLGYKYQLTRALKATASLYDVFDGQLVHRFFAAPTFTEDYRRRYVGRVLYVGLSYSFGFANKGAQSNSDEEP
jgi:outer membrane receptor protein involved in Fe transport